MASVVDVVYRIETLLARANKQADMREIGNQVLFIKSSPLKFKWSCSQEWNNERMRGREEIKMKIIRLATGSFLSLSLNTILEARRQPSF